MLEHLVDVLDRTSDVENGSIVEYIDSPDHLLDGIARDWCVEAEDLRKMDVSYLEDTADASRTSKAYLDGHEGHDAK